MKKVIAIALTALTLAGVALLSNNTTSATLSNSVHVAEIPVEDGYPLPPPSSLQTNKKTSTNKDS